MRALPGVIGSAAGVVIGMVVLDLGGSWKHAAAMLVIYLLGVAFAEVRMHVGQHPLHALDDARWEQEQRAARDARR